MYASINLFIYGKTYFVKRTTIYPHTAVFRIIVNSTGFEPASPQTLLFKNSTLKSSYESNVSLVAQTFLSGYSLKYHRQECLCHHLCGKLLCHPTSAGYARGQSFQFALVHVCPGYFPTSRRSARKLGKRVMARNFSTVLW